MKEYIFSVEMQVRDYELDSEGIVNNANYLHYLEHTRHLFCAENGISFIEMQRRGYTPVVNKVVIEYKESLRGDDKFVSKLWFEKKGVRAVFHQDIFKKDGTLVVKAVVSSVFLKNGTIDRGELIFEVFKKFLS